jgi:hypothetical protein
MDDSHEVIINTTPSRDIEGDQDITLPLIRRLKQEQ